METNNEMGMNDFTKINTDDFKLLSINEAAKMFGIRYENVKKLIDEGKLHVIKMGKRIKIPVINIFEFIKSESSNHSPDVSDTGIISIEETQNQIDSIIRKHSEE